MARAADPTDGRPDELTAALARVAAGDRAAMRLIYDRSSGRLFGICLRICRDREVAADVLQEAYLKVWSRAGRFDASRAHPLAWLATIARNCAIDWARANRAVKVDLDAVAELADDQPLASDMIETREGTARIHHCLQELDEHHRESARAIRSAFFDGATYGQLAERMSVPLGTMKSWIRRGLLRLRECLRDG